MDPFPSALCVLIVASGSVGFFLDGPCDLYPSHTRTNADHEQTSEATVKVSCQNGTLNWAYPQGHVLLYFSNPSAKSESVCISDWIGGQSFTITDITDGRSAPLNGNITKESYACTVITTASEVVLKVEAPAYHQYFAGVKYLVKRDT